LALQNFNCRLLQRRITSGKGRPLQFAAAKGERLCFKLRSSLPPRCRKGHHCFKHIVGDSADEDDGAAYGVAVWGGKGTGRTAMPGYRVGVLFSFFLVGCA
jgi:hypothetical protein